MGSNRGTLLHNHWQASASRVISIYGMSAQRRLYECIYLSRCGWGSPLDNPHGAPVRVPGCRTGGVSCSSKTGEIRRPQMDPSYPPFVHSASSRTLKRHYDGAPLVETLFPCRPTPLRDFCRVRLLPYQWGRARLKLPIAKSSASAADR